MTTPPARPRKLRRESMLLSCRSGGASDGSGDVHVQRPRHRGRRRAGRVLALRAARAARPRLGEGRLRAPGPVRLLHRAGRRRRRGSRASPRPRGSRAARSRPSRASTRQSATGRASAFVATGGSQCGFCTPGIVMRAVAARPARASTGRSPRTCAGAPAGARCTKPSSGTVERADRDLAAASRRARRSRAACTSASSVDVPLGGGGFADDTAPRDALVAVPLPPGSDADFVEAAGMRWVVGASVEARAHRGGEGAGPAHDGRRRAAVAVAARCRTAACGSRRRGSSPRTSSPTRRGASPAASPRRRSRTAARSAARSTRARPKPRASSPRTSVARCASSTHAKTSCASARNGRRSRRLRCGATVGW